MDLFAKFPSKFKVASSGGVKFAWRNIYVLYITVFASWWFHAVTWSSFRGQYSFTSIPLFDSEALWTSAQMWSTGKKEVHLLWATRTTQTWQRPPVLPPALPYAHLRAHLQKSPASCSVYVPGWIKPIGSTDTPRCVSGCVPLLNPGWIKPIGSTPRCVSGCAHPSRAYF